ncbi:MAG TPA: SIMPL domain-containing protein [Steroidobacteraceae bacterium]|nr:SIMPL domain-containing protein [Steroidobacteraceae bacterium]
MSITSRLAHTWPVLLIAAATLTAAAVPAAAAERTVSVSGTGEVLAPPDRATVSLGVEARRTELDAARAEVNRSVEELLALTKELGIAPERVDATRVTVRPEYDWDPEQRQRRFLGYYVARQVTVDLRDLDKLGRLIERSVDLGVNQLGDPVLDSSRRQELEREALALAVKDARRNAEAIAKAADANLGPVRSISAVSRGIGPMPPRPMMEARVASDAGSPESYVTGDLRFSANVQAEYDLAVAAR